MTKFFLAFLVVAALAFDKSSAATLTEDVDAEAGDVACIFCKQIAGIIEVELSQGISQETVMQNIKEFCVKLPKPLQITCHDLVLHDLTKFVAAVATTKGNFKQACQSIDKCENSNSHWIELSKKPIECLHCEILAGSIYNLIRHGATRDQIQQNTLQFCSRLLLPLKDSCKSLVTSELTTFLAAITAANGAVNKVCVALDKCTTPLKVDSPICATCEVKGGVLVAGISSGMTLNQFEHAAAYSCSELPEQESLTCVEHYLDYIKPLFAALNANDLDVRKACVSVNECHDEAKPDRPELNNVFVCSKCEMVTDATKAAAAFDHGQTTEQIDAALKQYCGPPELVKNLCANVYNNLEALDAATEKYGGINLKTDQSLTVEL